MAHRQDTTNTTTAPAVCQFTVAIDTREQLAYTFESIRADAGADLQRRPIVIRTARQTLQSGDYSIVGLESAVSVERKSLSDAFNTIGQGRARFERELERLQSTVRWSAVVIESQWSDILHNPPERSKLDPKTVFRSIIAWQQRFPSVHWWAVPGRAAGEVTTYRILERAWMQEKKMAASGSPPFEWNINRMAGAKR